jgi:hypothetical protein
MRQHTSVKEDSETTVKQGGGNTKTDVKNVVSDTKCPHKKSKRKKKKKRGNGSARTLQNVPSDAPSKAKVWRVAKRKLRG